MMKRLHLLLLFIFFGSTQLLLAQENDPCSAPCLSPTGVQSNSTPPADGFSPNNILPCGGGTSEDNSTWYTFVATSNTFSITATSGACTNGSNIQVTFFEGDDCGSVGAAGCINCVAGGSITLACTPGKQYWVQIDGCAEAVCPFTLIYDPQVQLPPPVITGPKPVCAGTEQCYTATMTGPSGPILPAGYTWTVTPAATKVSQDDETGTVCYKFPKAGTYKICAKPKFGKCPPPNPQTGCFDVTVFELVDSKCSITLCCEDKPFDYDISNCVKQFNPTIPGTPDPSILTIDQPCGSSKVYTVPFELVPNGCMGKAIITATLKPKPVVNLPPFLICEDDSVKVGSKWLKCADAKAGVQNYIVEYDPSPQVCDTTYNFILQCIKITPIVTPPSAVIDCINTSVTINAGGSIFSPVSTAANPGVKSYQWSANAGNATTPSITVTKAGVYCVTISYTYTLNTAQGSLTKTCQKVRCITITGDGVDPVPPAPYGLDPYPCIGSTTGYTVTKNIGTDYIWTITGGTPTNFTGDTIQVNWGTTPPFQVCVKSKNVCGESKDTCYNVKLNEPPTKPIITGNNPVCQNDSAYYSVTPIATPNASYAWTVPAGFTIKGKQDTSTILVMFGATASTGDITCIVSDKCGSSPPGLLTVVVNELPGVVTAINGKTNVCKDEKVTYSVASIPFATKYNWVVTGGIPNLISTTTPTLDVTWISLGTTTTPNKICVSAVNNCDTVGTQYCIDITVNDYPKPNAGSDKPTCGLSVNLNASKLVGTLTGKWTQISGPGTSAFTDDTDEKTKVDVSECGIYKYQWEVTNSAGCSGKDTVQITYDSPPTLAGKVTSCDPVALTFNYGFDIVGCSSSYTVSGMGKNEVVNTPPFTFNSGNLPQIGNNVVTYQIQAGVCTVTLLDSVNCNCITKVGDMDLLPVQTACSQGGTIQAFHKAGTEVNDGDDAFAYILYDGTSSAVITAISINKTGIFSFNPATMTCDKSYYIGYLAGNDVGGFPDPNDKCFQISKQNQEVKWDCMPTPNAGVSQTLCGLAATLSAVTPPTGTTGVWHSNGNGVFSSPTSPTTTVVITPPAGTYPFTWVETKGKCKDSATVNIKFKQSNLVTSPEKYTCDTQNENYTIKFDVSGGTPPYLILDCTTNAIIATLNTAPYSFTSGFVKSGDPYCFKVSDSNECDTITVQKSYACGCTSYAGNFTVADVCVDADMQAVRGNSDVLDGNDTYEFFLTDNCNLKDPAINIIARNQTGKFTFDAATMQCDQTYQMVYAVGTKTASGTSVKLDDACLSSICKPVKFVCIPAPTASIISIDTCGLKVLLDATPITNGSWTGVSSTGVAIDPTKFTDINDPNATATVPDFGSYTFKWTAVNGICSNSKTVDCSLISPSALAFAETFTCDNTDKKYVLTVNLTGKAPFNLGVASTVSGNIVGNQFISDPITSGQKVTLSVSDIESCKPLIKDFEHTCPCESKAGSMSNTQIDKCEGETITVNAPPASGIFLDGDDTFEFYLHEGSGKSLANAIQHNKTGVFAFDAANMQYDKLYYVSYVVGDKKSNNEVDLNYFCKDVSQGTPVIWHANPTAIIGTDATICKGSGANININMTGKAAFEIYYKEGTQAAVPLTSLNNNYVFPVTPTSTTTYEFTKIIDANKCFVDVNKNVTVTVNEVGKSGVPTNGVSQCFGENKTYTLSNELVGADLGGVWSIDPPVSGFDATNGTLNAKSAPPATYTVTYTVKGKKPCPDVSSSFKVIVYPIPIANAGADQELNCDNREITLGGNSTTGSNIVYNWISLSGVALSNDKILSPTTKLPGKFALEVKDNVSSCFSRDTCIVKEDLNTVDSASFTVVQPNCFGQDNGVIAVDKVYGGTPAYQFSINKGPYLPYKQFPNLKAGNYFIKIKDSKGCLWSDSVYVDQPYEITVDLGDDKEIELGQTADITALTNFKDAELKKLIWYPACDSCKTLDIVVKPEETTLYGITVYNNKGCIAKDNVLVRVSKPRRVFIPNVFYPESTVDDRNRKLKVFLGLDVKKVHFFRVYDRWGDVVYEDVDFTRDQVYSQDKGWDGTFRGQLSQPGVFTYSCKVEFVDGYIEVYKGDVLMLLK